ncbi:unnamed protein product [Periconia digitata]|uniref:Uncharacterized protein n=1 Tax=Periconia digitata TaxID=1303443 RepID=A0A9W4XIW5_9PLEO|nr:unnamed protein product [Periconia digitata]
MKSLTIRMAESLFIYPLSFTIYTSSSSRTFRAHPINCPQSRIPTPPPNLQSSKKQRKDSPPTRPTHHHMQKSKGGQSVRSHPKPGIRTQVTGTKKSTDANSGLSVMAILYFPMYCNPLVILLCQVCSCSLA